MIRKLWTLSAVSAVEGKTAGFRATPWSVGWYEDFSDSVKSGKEEDGKVFCAPGRACVRAAS